MTIQSKVSAVAVAGVTALVLAGCSGSSEDTNDATATTAAPVEASTDPAPTATGDAPAASDVDENIAAAEVLGGANLPDEWSPDVPIPDGKILIATWQEIGGTSLGQGTFYVADAGAQQAYLDQLTAAGFEINMSDDALQPPQGTNYDATSSSWSMMVVLDELDGNPVVMLVNVFPL